tara:strand:- start:2600 stop:3646 length:1047 start_codon:yes stop_codon:yes gene_type:complete
MKLNNKNIVPFDQFMSEMLYNKKKGYYMRSNPFGKNGDFTTAPNISIMFSEMIAIWCVSFWKSSGQPNKINIIELGAGNGEMIFQIINIFNKFNIKAKFFIIEKSSYLKKLQKKKLKSHNVKWLNSISDLKSKNNIFLANELFDALPVKQFFKKDNSWFELYIKKNANGKYRYVSYKIDINKLEKKFDIKLSKNQKIVEFSIQAYNFISKISKKIKNSKSGMLIIDYGSTKEKMQNSIQAIHNHKYINILKKPYLSDISYCPNFNLLKKIIKKNKLFVNGITNQKLFLERMGIVNRAEILSKNLSFSSKANIYYRLNRLIDKKCMGELFKVMFVTKNKKLFNLGFQND